MNTGIDRVVTASANCDFHVRLRRASCPRKGTTRVLGTDVEIGGVSPDLEP
jgi:hypothetical protein